jgi:SAM-dependent methyltransferase
VFRFPAPSLEALRIAYESMPVGHWANQTPPWWEWTREAILRFAPNRRVLDVGCFRGDFLATLGPEFERFGVEPNIQAAEVARSRGTLIIGRSIDDQADAFKGQFGAIVLMDVIEHLHDPCAALRRLKELLAPGGLLIVLSGDAQSWPARLSLPFYWYMKYPIHLVYLGSRSMGWIERELGLKRVVWRRLAHERGPFKARLRERAVCVAIALWQRINRTPLRGPVGACWPFSRVRHFREPPFLGLLRDHFWAVLRAGS